jgi:DNA polymerase I-like protein with 3'-5' exonuclease and polymerase domains
MRLANQEDVKNYLKDQGWVPTLWNLKKDKTGKPVKVKGKAIQTSPKLQEQGQLCPNLEALDGPLAKMIVRWLSLRNRKSVVEGWLSNERLERDHCLSAGASGIANTHRQRHTEVVNVPKADPSVTLGKEMRALYTARPGRYLVGFDAHALEARVEAHYVIPYEGGEEYAAELIEGDIHMRTVESVFGDKIRKKLGDIPLDKEHPLVKMYRSKSKNVKYASSYGAQPEKLAATAGLPSSEGQIIFDRFWEGARPLKLFKDKLEQFWEERGNKKWVEAIDGRRVYSRSKHSLVNLVFQSCGAIVMDTAGLFLNKALGGIKWSIDKTPVYQYNASKIYRTGYFHDEYVFDCPSEEIAEEVGEMGCKAIEKAGEYLKLRVKTTASYKVGKTWADIH